MKLAVEHFPKPAPSFAGNAALVLIVVFFIGAIASVLAAILNNACSLGCP